MRRVGGGLRLLGLGAKLAWSGGRDGWLRAGLTAAGIGLGVALLLLAASVPTAWQEREEREDRVQVSWAQQAEPGPGTVLVDQADLEFRDQRVRGVRVRPEGPEAPLPPGVSAFPPPGELVVSPALAALLASPDGELLRPRLDYPIAGMIGDAGLWHPHELAYFLGDDTLAPAGDGLEGALAQRIDHFGLDAGPGGRMEPVLVLLLAVGLTVLLLPVAMFVGVAVRFGGEQRDRRLAAVRLAGADARMVGWIAAGETLLAALIGLALGGLFFLIGRQLAEQVEVFGTGVFAADLRPVPGLLALVLVGVPVVAVAATMLALRDLGVEPLAVVRRARGVRRRLWWRVALPAAGLALLLPVLNTGLTGSDSAYQTAAGVGLVLLGVATLLPWLVDVLVRRWRGRGPVAWQLAVRRLQVSGGSTGRTVNGIAVAVAGVIALQMLFTGAQGDFVTDQREQWPEFADQDPATVHLDDNGDAGAAAVRAAYAGISGVRSVAALRSVSVSGPDGSASVGVGTCPDLRAVARLDSCADGDVFVTGKTAPGDTLGEWRVPDPAHAAELHHHPLFDPPDVLATPGAGFRDRDASYLAVYLTLDPEVPDAIEQVRNTTYEFDPRRNVGTWLPVNEGSQFRTIRRGLLVGLGLALGMIALSLLVGTVEQLRERRRQLAVLVAFGTQRRTLAWSVLWQAAVPIVFGLALALVAGLGLGRVLLALVDGPVRVDVPHLATVTGVAAGAVVLVTVLSLPVLWRLMRPDGLRTE